MLRWPQPLYISLPRSLSLSLSLSLSASVKMARMKVEEEAEQSPSGSSVVVGLRILVNVKHRKPQPHLLTKQAIKPPSSSFPPKNYTSLPQFSSFLKSCCLCNKKLSPHKDVYMYRGDQGYCSVECRHRQIILDDMKESEASIKKLNASSRRCHESNRRRQPHSLLSYREDSALIL